MEFPSSKPTEFFDAQEDVVDEGRFGREDERSLQRSHSSSQERNEQSLEERSESPPPANRLPYLQLLPLVTNKLYPTINALIADT